MLSITVPAGVPALPIVSPESSVPHANIISVAKDGTLKWRGKTFRCATGGGGLKLTKREGDGATPIGCFSLRRVLYRPDRVEVPESLLGVEPIYENDGWCDAPKGPAYNQPVSLPHAASAEALWRDDNAYDIIVVLGHNDDPVVENCGSAIFLHVANADFAPTEGCIAVSRDDLIEILKDCDPATQMYVLD
jgi:L,D-peptidoglycan transpeptidase YkuD (ErfK/YbiS/YcfS/YnhG family)